MLEKKNCLQNNKIVISDHKNFEILKAPFKIASTKKNK